MNVAWYSIYHPSKLKYSNIKLRARFAPIVAASIKPPFQKTLHIPFNMETRLKSVAAYLNQYQLIPFGRLSETFFDLFSHHLSQSTLIDTNQACYDALESVEESSSNS
ncbi:MAG: hypothetical protein PHW87_12930 [Methanothrix sp.]|nr:hypothetical protein [Methanothrix sp.]